MSQGYRGEVSEKKKIIIIIIMEGPFLGISKWGGHRFHMEKGKNICKTLVQVVI